MKRALTFTLAALLLAGCTTQAPAPASLKVSCDNLAAVTKEFGQVAPDAKRYADFLPMVKAIADAGDATTKETLAPMLAAFEKGAAGGGMGDWITAGVNVAVQCSLAGSTAYTGASASPSVTPSASTPATGCGLVSYDVVEAILSDSGRTAVESASARSGVGPWLVALKLRNGDVGVWVVDSIIDPAVVLAADSTAAAVSGWGMAGPDEYGSHTAIASARACVA